MESEREPQGEAETIDTTGSTKAKALIPEFVSHAICALIILTCGGFYLSTLHHAHNWGGDFSAYIMQAQSISQFEPSAYMERNRFTVEESSSRMGPVAYPWGFPLLLAPIVAIFGLNFVALKIVGVLCYLGFLAVVYYGFRRYHDRLWLLLLLLIFAVNPYFLGFANHVLSDIPFLLLSTAAILFMGRVVLQQQYFRDPFVDHCLLGLLIAAAFTVRTNGIVIFITLCCVHTLLIFIRSCRKTKLSNAEATDDHKTSEAAPAHFFARLREQLWPSNLSRKQQLAQYMPYVSFFGLMLMWRLLLPGGGSSHMLHLHMISSDSIAGNASYYANLIVHLFHGIPHAQIVYYISLFFVGLGMICRWRDIHIFVYLLGTLALFIIWPYKQGLRFIFPILPFYISFMISGFALFSGGKRMWVRCLRYTPVVIPVIVYIYFSALSFWQISQKQPNLNGPLSDISTEAFDYIREHIDASETIVFFKPRVMRMLTGHNTLRLNNSENFKGARYVCIWRKRQPMHIKHMQAIEQAGQAAEEFRNKHFVIYRLHE